LSYALYADDLLALVDHLHLARSTLIGWSDGGNTALHFALDHPDRVCRLVLISANFSPHGLRPIAPHDKPPETFAKRGARWLLERFGDSRRSERRRAELLGLWQALPAITEADLNGLTVPVLIVGGEFDVVDPSHLHTMHRALPDASLEILPAVGHGLPYDAPRRLNALIAEFLSGGPVRDCGS